MGLSMCPTMTSLASCHLPDPPPGKAFSIGVQTSTLLSGFSKTLQSYLILTQTRDPTPWGIVRKKSTYNETSDQLLPMQSSAKSLHKSFVSPPRGILNLEPYRFNPCSSTSCGIN